jgi:EmrB/QacA subfamily drug resistance transporter
LRNVLHSYKIATMISGCSLKSGTGRWILTATLLASGTAFLMGSAVIVALPAIQSHFSTNLAGIQWVVNAHLLSLASFLMIGGSLGDRFGRKRIFTVGITIFIVCSILSGLATTIEFLITFQALQGIGSALMIPQCLAIINSCFVEEQRGRAIGVWAGLSGGVAALGPLVGGWLVDTISWQAVFFMVLPTGLLALAAAIIFIPESKDPSARSSDWLGAVAILLGLLGSAYGLISGPVDGWNNALVLTGLIGGPLAIVLFIIIESRSAHPLVPLHIFKNSLVSGANAVTFLLYFALNGLIFSIALNLQQIQGYSPSVAGLGLLPPIILITLFAAPAGALADKIGPRIQLVSGPMIVALGIALLIIPGVGASYVNDFLAGLILFGIGMALVIAPLTKSALNVDTQYSGAASGVNNAISRIAALMAIAILGVITVSAFTARLDGIISASNLTLVEKELILSQASKVGGITIPDTFSEAARSLVSDAVRQSFVYGFRLSMIVSAALALGGSLVSFMITRKLQRISPEHNSSTQSK